MTGKRFEMYNDTVLGFNKSGKDVARIQVESRSTSGPPNGSTGCSPSLCPMCGRTSGSPSPLAQRQDVLSEQIVDPSVKVTIK
ncbi:MAG TPA: hypothetical protein VFT89_00680 [Rhizobiaceae bacterium]|nr:hypothetical protein [Rhizobiaceae bacterium]